MLDVRWHGVFCDWYLIYFQEIMTAKPEYKSDVMGNTAIQACTENLSLSTLLSVTELKELKGVQHCNEKLLVR